MPSAQMFSSQVRFEVFRFDVLFFSDYLESRWIRCLCVTTQSTPGCTQENTAHLILLHHHFGAKLDNMLRSQHHSELALDGLTSGGASWHFNLHLSAVWCLNCECLAWPHSFRNRHLHPCQ